MESSSRAPRRTAQDELPERRSLEREVAQLWGELLDGREIGPHDDFFASGGNSLVGIKIIERVSQDYGVDLSVRSFYLAQTPARVAELIEQGRARR